MYLEICECMAYVPSTLATEIDPTRHTSNAGDWKAPTSPFHAQLMVLLTSEAQV